MRCRWCGQPVRLVRDLWLTEDGQLCTPQLRGAVCAMHYYRDQFGIDPLTLLNHDMECACRRTIMHLPTRDGRTDQHAG